MTWIKIQGWTKEYKE